MKTQSRKQTWESLLQTALDKGKAKDKREAIDKREAAYYMAHDHADALLENAHRDMYGKPPPAQPATIYNMPDLSCPCGKTDAHSHRIAEAGGSSRALTHVEIIGRMQGSGGKPAALVMGECPVVSPMISDRVESTLTCATPIMSGDDNGFTHDSDCSCAPCQDNVRRPPCPICRDRHHPHCKPCSMNRDKIAVVTADGITLFECAKHGGLYKHGKRCYRCEPMTDGEHRENECLPDRDDVDPATGVKLSQDEYYRRYGVPHRMRI